MSDDNLKLIFSNVVRGYSSFILDSRTYYIKHLNALDNSDIDIKKQEYLDFFVSQKVLTYKEKLAELEKDNLWSIKKDAEVDEIKAFIVNLHHSKKQYTTKKDKRLIDIEIESYTKRLDNLLLEKSQLIGMTAESRAEQRISEFYMFVSLFKDKTLSERFYSDEEFEYLDDKFISQLIRAYNKTMSRFNEENLKRVSLMPNFFNLFVLAGDNIVDLFGKPIIELTFYQIELIQNARQYQSILQSSEVKPAPEVLANYDKLIEWFGVYENSKKLINNDLKNNTGVSEAGAASITGMTKEELEASGMNTTGNQRLNEELKKKGSLSMEDILRLEGIK